MIVSANNFTADHDNQERIASRTRELFEQQRNKLHTETHQIFILILILQWIGGIFTAALVSPRTWIGAESQVHIHVWAAILLGGCISSCPIFMAIKFPKLTATRHVIAVSQMLWSMLLIHLSGGRIETHFHVFGSLAFLAFYRDWRVLLTATIVVTLDHLLRGLYWPQSVFGALSTSSFRWMEHAAWVLFENAFLAASCVRGVREMKDICRRRSLLENTNREIEQIVNQRTAELLNLSDRLATANQSLKSEITERRRAENQFRLMVESSPNGILMFCDKGFVKLVNGETQRLFGFNRNGLVGKEIETLLPGLVSLKQDWQVRLGESQGEKQQRNDNSFEIAGYRNDGKTFPVEVGFTEVKVENQTYTLVSIVDISQRRETEIQVRHSQKLEAVGRLASGVAHEINSPMQFVGDNLAYLETSFNRVCDVLSTYRSLDSENESFADQIKSAEATAQAKKVDKLLRNIPAAFEDARNGASRVSKIVHAMKELVHPGSDQKEFADINQLVSSAIAVSRHEWKYVANIEEKLAPDLPEVLCQPVELNQVILNLILNASYAVSENRSEAGDKGNIIVSTQCNDDCIEIEVRDDGPGIPQEIHDRLFEPFFTTKPVGEGSGQGLAIARAVVVQGHNGAISVQSPGEGGTSFIINIPIRSGSGVDVKEKITRSHS